MHPQQKAAWFTLIVVGSTFVLYGAAVPTLSWWLHRSLSEAAIPALGLFGFLGLTGLAGVFYRAPTGGSSKEPIMDERDNLLSTQAWNTGMKIFWLTFVLAGMATWAWLRYARGLERITVPVEVFPGILFASYVIFTVASSLAILHSYGWKAHDGR